MFVVHQHLKLREMEKLLVVKVLVWLCNQLSIVAQEAILIKKLVNLHFLLIFLKLFVLRLIVMLMMILVVLIDVGLQGMLSLFVLRRSKSCAAKMKLKMLSS
ncbi:thaumatin protein [Trifolium repens]|nr:thaumatin protein [Trifolium repens]